MDLKNKDGFYEKTKKINLKNKYEFKRDRLKDKGCVN